MGWKMKAEQCRDTRCGVQIGGVGIALIFSSALLLFVPGWTGAAAAQDREPGYWRTDLVSNGFIWTPNWDSSLVNPWGIACPPDAGPWWVADEGRGRATLYTGEGMAFPGLAPLVVLTPPGHGSYKNSAPTGMVFNGTDDFEIAPAAPARFILVTREGAITAYNSDVDRHYAVLIRDDASAVYTGVAIAVKHGDNALYVANFRQKRIDIFNSDFGRVLPGSRAFTDPLVPDDFSPYNIQNIGGYLFVAFAKPSPDGLNAVAGEDMGFVDAFDADGNLLKRLEQGPWMNIPWGMSLAPREFGLFGGYLLIGNSGSGRIAAFDFESGTFAGYLHDETDNAVLSITGLHALGFGNGDLAGPVTSLYFSAGFREGAPNIFGAITTGPVAGITDTVPRPGPPTLY
jgi:uncharacterized protein (TIGR03118 family)